MLQDCFFGGAISVTMPSQEAHQAFKTIEDLQKKLHSVWVLCWLFDIKIHRANVLLIAFDASHDGLHSKVYSGAWKAAKNMFPGENAKWAEAGVDARANFLQKLKDDGVEIAKSI